MFSKKIRKIIITATLITLCSGILPCGKGYAMVNSNVTEVCSVTPEVITELDITCKSIVEATKPIPGLGQITTIISGILISAKTLYELTKDAKGIIQFDVQYFDYIKTEFGVLGKPNGIIEFLGENENVEKKIIFDDNGEIKYILERSGADYRIYSVDEAGNIVGEKRDITADEYLKYVFIPRGMADKTFVDITKYINERLEEGDLVVKEVQKITKIKARRGKEGEKITTIVNRQVETRNRVKKYDDGTTDWIITNPSGEEYIVTPEVFEEKYMELPEEPGSYLPKIRPVLSIEVNSNIEFNTKWNEKMSVKKGGHLIINSSEDVHAVEKTAFEQTYKETPKSPKQALKELIKIIRNKTGAIFIPVTISLGKKILEDIYSTKDLPTKWI